MPRNERSILRPTFGQLWTFLGFALPALAALLVPMPAVDLAYQLRAGGSILGGAGIPAVETWSFTVPGTPWLDQQWGAQALLTLVFQVGAWTGLAILRAVLVGVAFWLLGKTLRLIGCASRPAAIIALLGFAVAAPALALRPQLFAIVLFAATMWILAERRAHPRRLWLIPVIAVAWANLHGSFPLVIILVGLAWLDEVARVRAARSSAGTTGTARRDLVRPADRLLGSTGLALIGAVSAFATLVNPFGIDVWRYIANLASNPSVAGLVSEWRPPTPLEPAGAVFYASLVVVLAVAWLRIRADGGRITAATVAPMATLITFGVLGAVTGRGLAWWALAAPVAAATLAHVAGFAARLPRLLQPTRALFSSTRAGLESRGSPLNAVVAGVLLLGAIALLPLWRPVGPAGVPIGTLSHAPQGIATELRAMVERGDLPPHARVWNPQTWGSWFELAAPEVLVAVDSRIELFPGELWTDARPVENGTGEWLSILDKYAADAFIVAKTQNPEINAALDGSPKWHLAYSDADGSIWLRSQVNATE